MSLCALWIKTRATRSNHAPVDTQPIVIMLFQINFSFSLSFSLRNNATGKRPLSASKEDKIKTPEVMKRKIEPRTMIKDPVLVDAPVRPALPRFTRYFRTAIATRSGPMSKDGDTPIADSPLTKAMDHESLEVPLRSSKQREQLVKATSSETDTAAELSAPSLVQYNPVGSLDGLPEDLLDRYQSRVFEEDSGSDLVSSLQRIRLGSLSSYLLDLDKRINVQKASSTTTHISVGQDEGLGAGEEADQSMRACDIADEERDELTLRETSDEEQ